MAGRIWTYGKMNRHIGKRKEIGGKMGPLNFSSRHEIQLAQGQSFHTTILRERITPVEPGNRPKV